MVDGIPGSPGSAGLIDKVKAILLKPKEEWPVIAADPATPGDIVTRYAIPLIAIGPIASFIGGQLFGYHALFFFSYQPSLMAGISSMIVAFVTQLIVLVAVTFAADFLAPKFGGEPNRRQALKWVAYSATASWVAGIFGLVPALSALGLLAGLYSLYLFYLGATPVMKVPEDKALGYTAVTVVAAIVLVWIATAITASVVGVFGGAAAMVSGHTETSSSGTVTIPGLGSVDTDRIQQAADRAQKMANGEIHALNASQLSPLLPASIGSYARVATSSTSTGMGSQAQATYKAGDKQFDLRVVDMAAVGGLAGIASAMGVEHSEEDADGYEKVYKDGDQMVTEKWSNSSSNGNYGVVVGDRFLIEAEGQAASIDELKSAVGTVDQDKLEDLAG